MEVSKSQDPKSSTRDPAMLLEEHITNGVTGQSVIDYILEHHGRHSFRLTFKHLTTSSHYTRRETHQEFNCTYLSRADIESLVDAFYQTPPPASLTLFSYLLYRQPESVRFR